MCNVCGRLYCTESCPAYSGDRSDGGRLVCICASCQKKLYQTDTITRSPHAALCEDCASSAQESNDSVWQTLINRRS